MRSHIGSWSRPARSAPENERSDATGLVRSAMLTYFGQIVIRERAATKGLYPPPRPKRIAPLAQARSWAGRNIPGVGPRRKSRRTNPRPQRLDRPPEEEA